MWGGICKGQNCIKKTKKVIHSGYEMEVFVLIGIDFAYLSSNLNKEIEKLKKVEDVR